MDTQKLWKNALAEIELNVSAATFNTWFKETAVSKQENGVVFLSVPNTFVKEWLQNKYHNFILKTLRDQAPEIRSLDYLISKDGRRREETKTGHEIKTNRELPLSELLVNKEDNLNPKYSFENFVVGPFNELAHAAAQAVIKKPGLAYNPLFIYGQTGVGKTHLIQAVGNQLKVVYPNKKIYYLTSEKFALDYINSVQANKINNFKEKYRRFDILIMDDVQFLSNKEKTQEELFHLFNNVFDNNKQIIFSSDKHPNYIPNLEERLKSRFGAGLIVDIPMPDQESRLAISRNKLKNQGIELPEEIVDFISGAVTSNIRELEGILNTVVCQYQLKNGLSLNEVKNLIKNNIQSIKNISVKEIVKIVAGFYNLEEEVIYKKTRKKEVIKPRQIIMYILREDFNISFPSIGEKLGGRDHTTVIHSCEKIKNELKVDAALLQELTQIRTMIN